MPSNLSDHGNNSDTVRTQVSPATMDPSYSHFRHVLTLLGRQCRNAGDPVGLQTLDHGEGAPAGRWAASQDRCWGQAEQRKHQEQDASLGQRTLSHTQKEHLLGGWRWRWSDGLCGSPKKEAARSSEELSGTLVHGHPPSWSGSDTEQQLYGAAGGAGERWASGDTVVVVVVVLVLVGWSLPPSLLHHGGREGHRNRGQSHQTPLEVRVEKGGRVGRGREDEDAAAEDEDEEMRFKNGNQSSSSPTPPASPHTSPVRHHRLSHVHTPPSIFDVNMDTREAKP